MKNTRLIRGAIAAALVIATALPGMAAAKVRYVGSGGPTTFGPFDVYADFDFVLPGFVTTPTTATYPVDGSCGAVAVSGGVPVFGGPCNTAVFDPSGTVTFDNTPIVFDYGPGAFGKYGTYTGTMNGAAATLTVSPGAPAPLLGLGLIPALAAGGGLVATRRRKTAR